MKAKVVIIINCFNSALFLEETIKSLLNQRYEELTLFFVENKSTDGTINILNSYARKYKNIQIHQLKNHLNLVNAREEALEYIEENIKFDFFAFCDSDDLWDPNWVSTLVELGKDFDLIYCNGYEFYLDRNRNKILKNVESSLACKKYDAYSSPLFLQSVIFSRNILTILKKNYLDLNLPMHYDIDLFLRLKKKEIKYIHLSKRLFYYRIHDKSLSSINSFSTIKERYYITKKHGFSRFIFVLKLFLYTLNCDKLINYFLRKSP